MANLNDVLSIISQYVDLSYKESHLNSRGINVDAYFDGRDSRYMYGKELEALGFNKIFSSSYATDWYSKDFLCCVSYCEHDLYVVSYKDIEQYESELNECIKFHKE